MDGILFRLFDHTNEALNKKDYRVAEENVSLFKDIFEEVLASSKSYSNSKIFGTTVNYINEIIVKMLNEGLYKESIELMDNILISYSDRDNYDCSYILSGDVLRKLIAVIEEQSFRQIHQLSIKHLLFNLVENSGENNGFVIDNYAPQMFSAYCYSILRNKNLNDEEKTKLIDEILELFFTYSYSSNIRKSKVKLNVFENSILSFLKAIIDRMDVQRLEKALLKIGEHSHHLQGSIDVYKIFLLIVIYIYYLALKEKLPDNEKNIYLSLLKETKIVPIYNTLINGSRTLWSYYNDAKSKLEGWERMPENEAKWLMMDYVVMEFFIFLSIAKGKFNLDNIKKENGEVLDEAEIFSFLDSYISENSIKDELVESYKVFINIFNFQTSNVDHSLKILKSQMLSKYKSIKFGELKDLNKKTDVIETNISLIKNSIEKSVRDIPYIKFFNNISSNEKVQDYSSVGFNINLHTYFLADKVEESYDSMSERVVHSLEEKLKYTLIHMGFLHKRLRYSDPNKINHLFQTIDDLEKSKNVIIDAMVSGISPDSYLLYMEDQGNKEKLKKFINKLEKTQETNQQIWVGMDTKKIKIGIEKLVIEVDRLTMIEIEQRLNECKKGDYYNINLTNNIFILMTKDEAIEYLKMSCFVVKFEIIYGYYIKEMTPGFILEVDFE